MFKKKKDSMRVCNLKAPIKKKKKVTSKKVKPITKPSTDFKFDLTKIRLLLTRITKLKSRKKILSCGIIRSIKDGVVKCNGLLRVKSGELVFLLGKKKKVQGMVLTLEKTSVSIVIFGKDSDISQGSKVIRTNRLMSIVLSSTLFGRVIDALGNPIDGYLKIVSKRRSKVDTKAIGIIPRQSVKEPMQTGITVIDSIVPIGCGQRELIIGDRQTGKSTIAIDTILNQKLYGHLHCIYVAISQKRSTIAQIVNFLKNYKAMKNTIVISATSSEPATLQFLAPYSGCAIGEWLAKTSCHALIVYDDLSKVWQVPMNCINVVKLAAKILVELLRYRNLSILLFTKQRTIYLKKRILQSLAKVFWWCYRYKVNIILRNISKIIRCISLVSLKLFLINNLIAIKKENISSIRNNIKYPRNFYFSRASLLKNFCRAEHYLEDIDIYLNETLEKQKYLLYKYSNKLIYYNDYVMEFGWKSKRFIAKCWVINIGLRLPGIINNKFVRNFSIYSKKDVFLWNNICFRELESNLYKIQKRIYKASQGGNNNSVIFLQEKIINYIGSKYIAVKKVTSENKRKRILDINNKIYLTSKEKIDLSWNIKIDGNVSNIKKINIPKNKEKSRSLLMHTTQDKVKQTLILMALEPEWEAKFESNSYGFRPGRSVHDAVKAIFNCLRSKSRVSKKKYILDCDIRQSFEKIDYSYVLNKLKTLPIIIKQVRAWLNIDILNCLNSESIESKLFFENQIGILSPFLKNIILHGMENIFKNWNNIDNKESSLLVIRYVDDFVIIHENLETLIKLKQILIEWFNNTSKLVLNEEKTKIVKSTHGFNFLGFRCINIYKNGNMKVKIYPSKKNQKNIIASISEICKKFRTIHTFKLIELLKPKILSWINYFKYIECKKVFNKLDYSIYQIFRSWVFRRDRKSGRMKIKEKYFPSGKVYLFNGKKYQDNWILFSKVKNNKGQILENWLPKLSWVKSLKYIKIVGKKSIYDGDEVYWSNRAKKYGNFNSLINYKYT